METLINLYESLLAYDPVEASMILAAALLGGVITVMVAKEMIGQKNASHNPFKK
jgi:hypothetical protein